MSDPVNIRDEFKFVRLNSIGIMKANEIAERFSHLLSFLESSGICQPGREIALVKTHLEEACFYAKKAVELDQNNQKQPAEDLDAE